MPDSRTLLSAAVAQDLHTIKGWFYASDRRMFAWMLERQARLGETGNVSSSAATSARARY